MKPSDNVARLKRAVGGLHNRNSIRRKRGRRHLPVFHHEDSDIVFGIDPYPFRIFKWQRVAYLPRTVYIIRNMISCNRWRREKNAQTATAIAIDSLRIIKREKSECIMRLRFSGECVGESEAQHLP